MVRKLYVGNLPFSVSENTLKDLFSQHGAVESVKIVTDTYDGRSKGFAFVEMSTPEEAALASQNLNGTELEGRSIRVDLARPKESRPRDNRGPRPAGAGDRRGGSSSGSRFGGGAGGREGGSRNRW